jgi:hypothetical protein
MLNVTAMQVLTQLRLVGNTVVKALALAPLTLVIALLATALLILPFTDKHHLVIDLIERLDHWTSTILNSPAQTSIRHPPHPKPGGNEGA